MKRVRFQVIMKHCLGVEILYRGLIAGGSLRIMRVYRVLANLYWPKEVLQHNRTNHYQMSILKWDRLLIRVSWIYLAAAILLNPERETSAILEMDKTIGTRVSFKHKTKKWRIKHMKSKRWSTKCNKNSSQLIRKMGFNGLSKCSGIKILQSRSRANTWKIICFL